MEFEDLKDNILQSYLCLGIPTLTQSDFHLHSYKYPNLKTKCSIYNNNSLIQEVFIVTGGGWNKDVTPSLLI